jgi:D-lactate dehydrogenase
LLGYDLFEDESLKKDYNLTYTDRESLCSQADIISLHLPLTPESKHLINKDLISKMKDGVMLINTSRGGLVDTKAVVNALKTRKIGYFGMDVYEEEAGLFFEDHSNDILQDDTLSRLMTFKNVLITSHQGFLTETALINIAQTTIENLTCFGEGKASGNEI